MIPFDQFWLEYPRKVGRIKAERAWWKLREQDRMFCMERLGLWKVSDDWRDPLYIPHASTFLNQRRWEDEPTIIQRRADGVGRLRPITPEQHAADLRDIAEIEKRYPDLR